MSTKELYSKKKIGSAISWISIILLYIESLIIQNSNQLAGHWIFYSQRKTHTSLVFLLFFSFVIVPTIKLFLTLSDNRSWKILDGDMVNIFLLGFSVLLAIIIAILFMKY